MRRSILFWGWLRPIRADWTAVASIMAESNATFRHDAGSFARVVSQDGLTTWPQWLDQS